MLRIKDLSLLESRRELSLLPEGKVLINTINAHSYNTAQKDPLFAEALQKGDALVPDGASHPNGLPVAEGQIAAEGTDCRMGSV